MASLMLAARQTNLQEFFSEPALTIACVLLMVVSVGWVVVSRLIVRNYRRAAARRRIRTDVVTPPRDIWSYPP